MATLDSAAPGYRDQTRPPPWRDVRVLRVFGQVLFLLLLFLLVRYLAGNLIENARRVNLALNFDYLKQPAGINIPDSPLRPTQAVREAVKYAFLNTIRMAGVGVVLATVLGTVMGVARLSTNFLVRKTAAVYVETLRNVPVLLWIIFFFLAVVLKLPPISAAAKFLDLIILSNRGLNLPWGEGQANNGTFILLLAAGLVLAVAVAVWRTRRFDATGAPHRRVLYGLGVFAVVGTLSYVALSAPVTLTTPSLDGRVVTGGIRLSAAYSSALIALVVYTGSHIAEIVRGSIQAVPKGQTEAAYSIALTGFQRLRYVVLPQALRVAIPPFGNQALNLTKNTSLALVVTYPELLQVTQNFIANGAPAPPSYVVMMGLYLSLSLSISLVVNVINRGLAVGSR